MDRDAIAFVDAGNGGQMVANAVASRTDLERTLAVSAIVSSNASSARATSVTSTVRNSIPVRLQFFTAETQEFQRSRAVACQVAMQRGRRRVSRPA